MRKLLRVIRFLQRHQNILWASLAFLTSLGLAITSGHWVFYRASYVLGGLIVLSYLWARASIRGLEVSAQRLGDRFQVGQLAEARITVRSRSIFPKLWLELEDGTDIPVRPARTIVSLRSHGQRTWEANTGCARRGLFHTGPVTVVSGDPFGLFRFRRRFGTLHSMLVYPSPEELPYFTVPPAQLSGGSNLRRQTNNLTSNAAGVREYSPGDGYNRIHWRTTARLGRLMVKTFDIDPSSQIWIVLDMESAIHAGQGEEATEEYAVRAACSISHHFLQSDRALGFLATGSSLSVIPAGRGALQYDQIQETLALAKADGGTPLAAVLAQEARQFNKHSTLVIITPSHREDWVGVAQDIAQRGARTVVVLLDAASFGARENPLLAYSALTASDILTYLIRRGDDLSLALGPLGVSDQPLGQAAETR